LCNIIIFIKTINYACL